MLLVVEESDRIVRYNGTPEFCDTGCRIQLLKHRISRKLLIPNEVFNSILSPGAMNFVSPMNHKNIVHRFQIGRFFCAAIGICVFFSSLVDAEEIGASSRGGGEATPNIKLNKDELAARFLNQATAGATPAGVAALSAALSANPNTAFSDWLKEQFAKPVSPESLSLTILRATYANDSAETSFGTHAPDAAAIRAGLMISDDTNGLRRMVAYALSQIFVVSDQDNTQLGGAAEGFCDWYDMLYRHAFSDFETILREVTYHPIMSDFLSSEGNAKAGFYNPASRPDENYAREVMQLFTIGLVQLKKDGSMVLDARGQAIPTYSQPEVTEVARVFTGLKFPVGMRLSGGKTPTDPKAVRQYKLYPGSVRYGRNELEEKRHDTGAKTFLGVTLPAGQDAAKDIDDTLRILCNHPNTAPFFARGMIQRMVTSNPSPAYIQRVARAFESSKGDMKTVIGAILLDDEARNPAYARKEDYGKLRETWLRVTHLSRAFHGQPVAEQPHYPIYSRKVLPQLGQYPLSAPSVFNFYLPDYQPPGLISERNATASDGSTLLVAPEFQILNSNTALLTPNFLMSLIQFEPEESKRNRWLWALDLTPQIGLAEDPSALVDNIATLLTGGTMSERTRRIILRSVNELTPSSDPDVLKRRARTAIYLAMISPDYAVQK